VAADRSAADRATAAGRSNRAFAIALAACATALALVEWRAGLLLTNDGPQRLYSSYVSAHLDDGALGYARFWDVTPTITGQGFTALFDLFHHALAWATAYRVVLVVALEAWAFAAVALVAALDTGDTGDNAREKRWLALIAFPLAHQWSFYLGFVDFYLGTAVGLLAIAVVASRSPRLTGARRAAIFVALTVVGSLLHVLATLLAIGAAGLFALVERPREVWRLVVAALPAVALAAWINAWTDLAQAEPATWLPPLTRVLQLVERFALGPWWRADIAVVALAIGLAGVAVGSRRDRAIGAAGLALLALTLALPFSGSWQLVSPRPITLAFVCLVAAAPIDRLRLGARARSLALVVVLAWSAAAFAWTASLHERLRDRDDALLAFLAAGPSARPDVVRVPIVLADVRVDDVPDFDPAIHVGQLAGVAWGGFVHYTQTGARAVHPLTARADFSASTFRAPDAKLIHAARGSVDEGERARLVDVIAAEAAPADEVIVLGGDRDIDRFTTRGYVARARGPGWFVGAAPQCRVRLVVEGLDAPGEASVGVGGSLAPSWRFDVGRGASALDLSVPCGPVFMDVTGCARATTTTTRDEVAILRCAR
jgi:hypothetical protein